MLRGVGAPDSGVMTGVSEAINRSTEQLRSGGSGGDTGVGSWHEVVSRITRQVTPNGRTDGRALVTQFSELIQLQADLGRYHLGVELVSKISESAAASLRKLQQQQ